MDIFGKITALFAPSEKFRKKAEKKNEAVDMLRQFNGGKKTFTKKELVRSMMHIVETDIQLDGKEWETLTMAVNKFSETPELCGKELGPMLKYIVVARLFGLVDEMGRFPKIKAK